MAVPMLPWGPFLFISDVLAYLDTVDPISVIHTFILSSILALVFGTTILAFYFKTISFFTPTDENLEKFDSPPNIIEDIDNDPSGFNDKSE